MEWVTNGHSGPIPRCVHVDRDGLGAPSCSTPRLRQQVPCRTHLGARPDRCLCRRDGGISSRTWRPNWSRTLLGQLELCLLHLAAARGGTARWTRCATRQRSRCPQRRRWRCRPRWLWVSCRRSLGPDKVSCSAARANQAYLHLVEQRSPTRSASITSAANFDSWEP
jgi:hypothetical protein